jgi:serine/threonine-protein kinase
MPLGPGDRLGPYEILALLGAGGMGEVYRGRDTRLGRDVALKVISPARVEDPSLRRRFELEARAASALNHPSIVTIYDVGETGGVSWIAMEWVEGRTLRQALSGGPLALREALSVARQVADGLAAAHAKGIVHRDLKPENVMITAEGRAKVLDFGLARVSRDEPPDEGSQAATREEPPDATRAGTILGTVGYMSPEQAAGRPVDFRSDQFSFGLISYEMLSGRRAFARPTAVETLAAIIREEPPPLESLRAGLPEPLVRLIATCLAKDPADRFASTRDLAAVLEGLAATSLAGTEAPTELRPAPSAPAPRLRSGGRRAIVLGVSVALVLAAVAVVRLRKPQDRVVSLAVLPFENASRDPDLEYLGDGLTESLIEQVSRLPSVTVMARATVFRHKGTVDPLAAGRSLGVGAVLTGSVARRDGRLAVSAELVETATGVRLWGQKYERPQSELLQVQDGIVAEVAARLRPGLSGQERRGLARHGTEDPEAWELYLKARFLLARDTDEDDLEARRLYRQALERDPKFVEARVGVSLTYARSAARGSARPGEAWPRAKEELQEALDLDPGNVLARCALANRRFLGEWDWAGAERDYRELVDEPRVLTSELFRPIALFHWARGRPDEAVALMEKALRADPGNLDSRQMLADFLAHDGRLDDATAAYRALAAAQPNDPFPLFGLAEVQRRRGDAAGTIEALRKAYVLSEEDVGTRALASARTEADCARAEAAVARARLAGLQEAAKEQYVSPLDLARLHAQAGERERALGGLEAALAERSPGLVFLKVERAWDGVRGDPRFAAVVRQVGIP